MSRKRIDRGMLAILLLSTLLLAVQAEPAQAQQDQNAELMDQMGTVTQKASQAVGELKNFFEDSRVQVAIVVVLVVLGLTLWLLGARAGRLLFALLLGTAAIIPGMYLFEVLELPSLWPGALVGGLLGMLVGVFIFKVGIMLVGMCISTLLAVGIFTAVGMEAEERAELAKAAQEWLVQVEQSSVVPRLYAAGETTYPVEETPIEGVSTTAGVVFQGQAEDLSSILGKLGGKYRNGLLVSAVAGLAGGLLLQLFARSFMLVLTTSFLGTSMVLGGVCLGLAFRGKQANELLGLKPISSMVIFVVMLGLGMLVQLTMTRKRGEAEEEEEEE